MKNAQSEYEFANTIYGYSTEAPDTYGYITTNNTTATSWEIAFAGSEWKMGPAGYAYSADAPFTRIWRDLETGEMTTTSIVTLRELCTFLNIKLAKKLAPFYLKDFANGEDVYK